MTVSKREFFTQKLVLRSLIITLLIVAAFGLRLYGIDEPLVDFAPTRQYHSAIIARGYYFEALQTAPEWQRDLAILNKQREGILEPPIMEMAASVAYRISGGEHLWIPRALSSIFWVVGGVFLYLIAKRIVSPRVAILSTAFYLFLPYGILASRSFQPDPLMIMALLSSLFSILRYYEQPSAHRLAIAALVSAFALFVKPGICFFQVFGLFIALGIHKQGIRNFLVRAHLVWFAVLSLSPMLVYFLYGSFIAGFLQEQVRQTFTPHLLAEPTFWAFWLKQVLDVVGSTYLIVALCGILVAREGLPRVLLISLWSSYLVFGLVFTYHIHTHDYYQLQLIPIVALSLGPVVALFPTDLRQIGTRFSRRAATLGIILLAGACVVLTTVVSLYEVEVRNPNTADYESKIEMYQEIGRIVDHSSSTLVSAPDYGLPLMYHGWLSGAAWPNDWETRAEQLESSPQTDIEERFNALDVEYAPTYFVIVRDFWHFEEQKILRGFLADRYHVVAEGEDYWVFDLGCSS